MKLREVQNKIVGITLGFTLLIGAGSIGMGLVRANNGNNSQGRRDRNWDGYPNWGGSFDLRQTALNAGYNEGTREGRKDRDRGRQSNYQDFSAYQNATKDYSSRLGDRELYRRYFREAFQRGYNTELGIQVDRDDDGRNRDRNDRPDQNRRGRNWDRYGTYGGSLELRQTALNAGYNEGIKEARNDRNKGRDSDFRNSSKYKKATKDYSSKLGNRELYRRYYREGFENGYGDGYEGY